MTHIDLAYIQQKNGEWFNSTAYNMWDGCRLLGIKTVPFEYEDVGSLDLSRETLVHGGIPAVTRSLSRLGVEYSHIETYPEELRPFLGREVWKTTLGEFRQGPRGMFIKPIHDHKLFVGHVMTGDFRDLIFTANHEDEIQIFASEVVNFVSEYRLFVNKGLVIGCKHYKGDFTVFPDFSVAYRAVEAFTQSPISYSLDLGITDDGRTLLVEVNDGYALGCYGLASVPYTNFVIDRWLQLVGLL